MKVQNKIICCFLLVFIIFIGACCFYSYQTNGRVDDYYPGSETGEIVSIDGETIIVNIGDEESSWLEGETIILDCSGYMIDVSEFHVGDNVWFNFHNDDAHVKENEVIVMSIVLKP